MFKIEKQITLSCIISADWIVSQHSYSMVSRQRWKFWYCQL